MSQPITTLLYSNLKAWLSTKGVWLVFGAAMVPFVLTAAWVGTHQGDITVDPIDVQGDATVVGDRINVTDGRTVEFVTFVRNDGSSSVGSFNASLSVGVVQQQGEQRVFRPQQTNQVTIDGLEPGESRRLNLTWEASVSRIGQLWVLADADRDDKVGEADEFNNQQLRPIHVAYAVPDIADAPDRPTNLTGKASANRTGDVRVEMTRVPTDPAAGSNVTFRATFTNTGPDEVVNASLDLELGRTFRGRFIPSRQSSETVTIPAGNSTVLNLTWQARPGSYWVRAHVNVTNANHDPDGGNNYVQEPFAVQPEVTQNPPPPEPPERLTLKQFYTDLLSLLHYRLLIPFIALFYAGGVVTDEQSQGNLPYLLTRPIERWLFPVTKFASGYAVAAVAVSLGILASFVVLFGSPEVDAGFLTSSLVLALIGLLVYGGFFVLLGTLVSRPYLVGVAFVIGWEAIAGNFVPWVENLTISKYLTDAIERVDIEQGFVLADQSVAIVVAAGAAFLLLAGLVMKHREFDV